MDIADLKQISVSPPQSLVSVNLQALCEIPVSAAQAYPALLCTQIYLCTMEAVQELHAAGSAVAGCGPAFAAIFTIHSKSKSENDVMIPSIFSSLHI